MWSAAFFFLVSSFFRQLRWSASWNVTSVKVPVDGSLCWNTHYFHFQAAFCSPENIISIITSSSFQGWFKMCSLTYAFFWDFRESPLMSSDPSSSSSTTSRTLPSPCRCTILLLAPLDKVGGEEWQLWLHVLRVSAHRWCMFSLLVWCELI